MKFRRKKIAKRRGSRTHGCGIKKNRGAGNRGGRGKAGTGKRADTKRPSVIQEYGPEYFGKKGFTSIKAPKQKVMNVGDLDKKIEKLVAQHSLKEEKGLFVIDAKKIGFSKILGAGITDKKIKLIVQSASAPAIKKIEEVGGEVVTPKKEPSGSHSKEQAKKEV